MPLTNGQISELVARAAEDETLDSNRFKALQRAARAAHFWPEEAYELIEQDRPLAELRAVGPWLAGVLGGWLRSDAPPEPPDPPPLRHGFLTLAEARATLADADSAWTEELRADLQMHTTYSDGRAPLRAMAEAAEALGYESVNITDHSQGLKIARGMDEAELAEQGADVAGLNAELDGMRARIRILHGIEMNLSPEGEGDMDPDSLARLDLVLGAFHSKLRVTEDQTDRYLRALRNPTIHVLAHPRGRRWNVRLGLQGDWRRVFREAAERGVALEVDAHPDRQDLDVELLALVVDAGCWISIGTDAHSTAELAFMEFGLAAAVRAGVPRERILNFMPRPDLLAWAAARRA